MRPAPIKVPSALAIHELSARIAHCNAMQTDPAMKFADILPAPTEDLAQVIAQMRDQGYTVGEPFRFTPTRRLNYVEWHVPVSKDDWHAVLAFFVEVSAC